jgi:hypothetical protein
VAPRARAAPPELDGGVIVERTDPLPPAGDLREDVARFGTLDSCVAEHAVLDPLIGDAVRSIGYDTLLRDACRVLQALKMKDKTACAAIIASSLQARCESLVAMALQEPEKCPWALTSEKSRGRDPMCLAVATHDPRTCGAAAEAQKATCEALATGDATRCGHAVGDERATCARDFERERTMLAGEHDTHETTAPRAHLEIHGTKGTKDPTVTDLDLSTSTLGGAVVSAEPIGGAAIDLARDLEATLRLPSRGERAHLVTSVVFEAGGPKLTKLELSVPRGPEIACPNAHCSLIVTMPKADPKRGAALSATFEGPVETPTGTYQLKLQIDTFVRDVVGRMSLFGGR